MNVFLNAAESREVPVSTHSSYLVALGNGNAIATHRVSIATHIDKKQSTVFLLGCLLVFLVLLLVLTFNLIHAIVQILRLCLVVSFICIILKVAVDIYYNRELRNPFRDYLNQLQPLPREKILKILKWTECILQNLVYCYNTLARLVLFDNVKATLKFAAALWILSYVTCHLDIQSILCILFSMVILLFSIPPLYERFQAQIDTHVDAALTRGRNLFDKIRSSIPYLGKSKVE